MKLNNLAEYNGLLSIQEQNLVDLNAELDLARLTAANENENMVSLLEQIDGQEQIVGQKSQSVQTEIDNVNLLNSEINSYLVSEQILIDNIVALDGQVLSKQQELVLFGENHQAILLDIQNLLSQKNVFELELVNVGIEKENTIELIDAKATHIEKLMRNKARLEDEILSLRDFIYVLEKDISLVEDHSFVESSVLIHVTINPNDLDQINIFYL